MSVTTTFSRSLYARLRAGVLAQRPVVRLGRRIGNAGPVGDPDRGENRWTGHPDLLTVPDSRPALEAVEDSALL